MEMQFKVLPEKKETEEDIKEFKELFTEINREVENMLNITEENPLEVTIFHSKHELKESLLKDAASEYGDVYDLENNKIFIGHPNVIEPIYGDRTHQKLRKIIYLTLTKLHLIKRYMNCEENFTLYKKNLINTISLILANEHTKEILNREIETFTETKKINSRDLISAFIYSLEILNGKEYIVQVLDELFNNNNIIEFSRATFNKEPKKVILMAQQKLKELKKEESIKS